MADQRRPYLVDIGGVKHTMLLTPAGARQYGDKAVEAKQAKKPANKARTVQNKSGK